jgi:hypothetical protein
MAAQDSWVWNKESSTMADKKPKGWGRFDEMMKKLVGVPKEQVDSRITEEQAKRKARRKPK